jgi:hypothetical protein
MRLCQNPYFADGLYAIKLICSASSSLDIVSAETKSYYQFRNLRLLCLRQFAREAGDDAVE